ncbi:DUF4332 domain-containing protein [Methylobacterium sp. WSM2598]|uniref:DUF4332 domain-containing protein n=1 Tax=Methylobacterium sp. WSM2598 TaxID=398261 RepID=UPI00036336CF|nr:DUF4332 domain-containing protein [Methylobacterium sp. WSM2598]
MAYLIETIGCIAPFLADRLRAAGIATSDALLARAGDPADRRRLADSTGIDAAQLLRWAERCDLFRVHGLARPMAELLESAGIRTVGDLAREEPASLGGRLAALNAERGHCPVSPTPRMVADWIARARRLAPRIAGEPGVAGEPAP